ncbi:hypothetical protein M426DRAFT_20690 [Hypoxylon sp. CI-4A]|nr:hypothetical protein M426DRAFT_20690 [Hypoxylon sp. CI-4A]
MPAAKHGPTHHCPGQKVNRGALAGNCRRITTRGITYCVKHQWLCDKCLFYQLSDEACSYCGRDYETHEADKKKEKEKKAKEESQKPGKLPKLEENLNGVPIEKTKPKAPKDKKKK